MVSENNESIEGLLDKYERQAQAYWDFMSQEEREQYAWLAGIIDGEGCISATRFFSKRDKCTVDSLQLSISMSSKQTIEHIKRIAGVGHIKKTVPKGLSKRIIYRWACSDREAASLLRHCLPFLVTKRAQALLAVELCEMKAMSRQRPTVAQLEKRGSLIRAISQLNKGED